MSYAPEWQAVEFATAPPDDRPRRSVVTGVVVDVEDGYPREVPVALPLLLALLAIAGVARLALMLLATVTRSAGSRGGRRSFKQLRKGPEFLVTPVWIRDFTGTAV